MKRIIASSVAVLVVSACSNGGGGDTAFAPAPTPVPPPPPPANAMFEVSVTNLTVAQPFSPIAVLLTEPGSPAFVVGEPASVGLEMLAESGDNSQLLADMDSRSETSGESPVAPGAETTFSLELDSSDPSNTELTVLTMLVNTNDAITGVQGVNVGNLGVDESMMITGITYDSGTEANNELAADIPGPAGGGEGFNATRDDVADRVTMHSGVVTMDDGLGSSDLTEQHRWDNPTIRVRVTRTQ